MTKNFPYKMVIFDVDGTILDTSEGLLASVKYTIQKHQLKELKREELLSFIGPPIQESFKKYYSISNQEAQVLANTFRNRYKEEDLLKAVPYENIYDLFDCLKKRNVIIAIATYKREDYALRLLKYFHFDRYTNIMYGADNMNLLKKADIIRKCIRRVEDIPLKSILVVGDSASDGIGAEINGCRFCGVTYGFGAKTPKDFERVNAIETIDSVQSLIDWINE